MISFDIKRIKSDVVFEKKLREKELIFHSTWGLFSPKNIDEGTELLINNIQVRQNDITLDLGCGYGPIGLTLAKLSPEGLVHMVDKDFVAIEYAQKNAEMNGIKNCSIYLSNGFSAVPDIKFDNIVANVPAKTGKELYWILIHDSKKHLKENGKVYFVFISHLKDFFKRNFEEVFGNYKTVASNGTYIVGMGVQTRL